jgi:ferredoxin
VSLTVTIDPELCVGSGDCVRLVPEAFQLVDELGVSVPRPDAGDADPRRLLEAALGCPTQAIRVVDEAGRVLHASNPG